MNINHPRTSSRENIWIIEGKVTVNWRNLCNKQSHDFTSRQRFWEIQFIVVEIEGESDKQCCGNRFCFYLEASCSFVRACLFHCIAKPKQRNTAETYRVVRRLVASPEYKT